MFRGRGTPAEPGKGAKCRARTRPNRELPGWLTVDTHVACVAEICVVAETGEHVVVMSNDSPLDHEFQVEGVCRNGGVQYRDAEGTESDKWLSGWVRVSGADNGRSTSERLVQTVVAERTSNDEAIEVVIGWRCLEAQGEDQTPPLLLRVDTRKTPGP